MRRRERRRGEKGEEKGKRRGGEGAVTNLFFLFYILYCFISVLLVCLLFLLLFLVLLFPSFFQLGEICRRLFPIPSGFKSKYTKMYPNCFLFFFLFSFYFNSFICLLVVSLSFVFVVKQLFDGSIDDAFEQQRFDNILVYADSLYLDKYDISRSPPPPLPITSSPLFSLLSPFSFLLSPFSSLPPLIISAEFW